jgi:hypothetical protein
MKPDIQWIGTLETCDLCGDEFPMSWVRFTGRQFLCAACDGRVLAKTHPVQESGRSGTMFGSSCNRMAKPK